MSGVGTLGEMVEFGADLEEADFWIQARGENIGKPSRTRGPGTLGVKVTDLEKLVPDYLYYVFEYMSSSGQFSQVRKLTPKLLSGIKVAAQ